jgi:hypothetical protein
MRTKYSISLFAADIHDLSALLSVSASMDGCMHFWPPGRVTSNAPHLYGPYLYSLKTILRLIPRRPVVWYIFLLDKYLDTEFCLVYTKHEILPLQKRRMAHGVRVRERQRPRPQRGDKHTADGAVKISAGGLPGS